ncbi:AI-2E family transporter [Clostridiaceae bacterium 35-E11]
MKQKIIMEILVVKNNRKESAMEGLKENLKEFFNIFKRVLKGKIKIALLLGVTAYSFFKLMHIPYAGVLSLVLFFSNLIPYIGIFIGGGMVVLIILFVGSWQQSLMALGVIIGLQLLEGMYLEPKVLGKEFNMHPIWIFIAVLLGGAVFGIPGMILAVPLAVFIKETIRK